MSIGARVRAVHLGQECAGGLGLPGPARGPSAVPRPATADSADHDARPAQKQCARCGDELSGGQPARRRADTSWVHESCPPQC